MRRIGERVYPIGRFQHMSILAVHDLCAVSVVALLASMAFPQIAWAYVDPSVLTYTIQAVAGVAVAISAVAGVLFRRTRRALMARLGIDENANKVREGDVHRVGSDMGGQAMYATADDFADKSGETVASTTNTPANSQKTAFSRLRSAVFVACVFVFTLFVVAPIEMVAGSAGSLVLGVEQVLPTIVLGACIIAVVLTLVLAVLPMRAFEIVRIVLICLTVCCWLQAMFLNGGLPSADGTPLALGNYPQQTLVSTIVWVVLIAGSLIAWCKSSRRHLLSSGLTVVACALLLVQGVGLISLLLPGSATQDLRTEMHSYVQTERGMFTVSSKNNVIVFVLDNYDTEHLAQAVSDEPGLLDEFSGFTWYQNSTGAMIPTRYGVPFLLTGQLPRYDEKFSTYLAERYPRSDYLSRIASTGATVGIYSDTLGLQYVSDEQAVDLVYGKAMNYTDANSFSIDTVDALGMLAKCALYRDMPWVLKPPFWFYTDEVNNALIDIDADAGLDATPYTMSDGRWYNQLKEYGLTFDEKPDSTAFRFIHLNGSHRPYVIDENGVDIGTDNSTRERQARGSMRMVGEYIHQLKDLGVYDQATIIVTADHGNYYLTPMPLKEAATPIMLVKPASAPDKPIEYSEVPVCAADVMPSVLTALGADAHGYGQPIWTLEDPNRLRRYLMTTSDGSHDVDILEYEITGDARDIANWKLTGKSWAAQS